MVAPRNTDSRLDGLEKVVGDLEKKTETLATTVNKLKIQCLKMDEGVSALGSQLEKFRAEMRAAFCYGNPNSTTGLFPKDSSNGHGSNTKIPDGTQPITIPTFDGSGAIAWLARAEQYFLVSKIPLENRVSVAMEALAGPALPWIQLLTRRIPTLSWHRFTQEMMKRFGDSIAWKPKSVAVRQDIPATITTSAIHTDINTKAINRVSMPLAVQQPIPPPVLVPLPSPTCPPTLATVTAPLLSSSPPTTAKENTLHAIQTCTPLTVQQPIPPPILVPLPSPPSLPTPATPLTPATPPTLAPVTASLLSTSGPYILQFQPPFSSLLRCLVSAAHQSTPMVVSFPGSLFSLVGAPFSCLVMLRFLHIVGNLLWFNALATTQKHEFEPPPDKVIGFNFDLSLEGKAVLRVRQLIRIVWPSECQQDSSTNLADWLVCST